MTAPDTTETGQKDNAMAKVEKLTSTVMSTSARAHGAPVLAVRSASAHPNAGAGAGRGTVVRWVVHESPSDFMTHSRAADRHLTRRLGVLPGVCLLLRSFAGNDIAMEDQIDAANGTFSPQSATRCMPSHQRLPRQYRPTSSLCHLRVALSVCVRVYDADDAAHW
jgi:hypothetical protein